MSTSGGTSGSGVGDMLAANNLSDVASRQTALNNLGGAVTNRAFIRGDATNLSVAAIQAADVPTLNQNTSGTAGGLSANIAESQVTNLTIDLGLKAPIASPTFTGTVTIPTGATITAPNISSPAVTGTLTVGAPTLSSGKAIAVVGSISVETGFLGLDFIGTEWGNGQSSLDLRSFGGTPGAETNTASGTVMAGFHVGGWNGSGVDCAQIQCRATQTFSGTQSGTAWDFYTTTNGTNVKTIALTLDNDGAATFRAGATIAGALAGVTNLTMAGTISGATNMFQIDSLDTTTVNVATSGFGIGMRTYAAQSIFRLTRVDGNSGAGTPVLSTELLAVVGFAGSTTTAASPTIYSGVQLEAVATENWSSTLGGTKLLLRTTGNGTHTRTIALTLDQDQSALFAGNVSLTTTSTLTMGEGGNVVVGTTTGTKFGTGTTQKIGFYNATPIVQRSGAAEAAVATTGSTLTTPFGYTTAAQADAIVTLVNEIRTTLVNLGLFKGSA